MTIIALQINWRARNNIRSSAKIWNQPTTTSTKEQEQRLQAMRTEWIMPGAGRTSSQAFRLENSDCWCCRSLGLDSWFCVRITTEFPSGRSCSRLRKPRRELFTTRFDSQQYTREFDSHILWKRPPTARRCAEPYYQQKQTSNRDALMINRATYQEILVTARAGCTVGLERWPGGTGRFRPECFRVHCTRGQSWPTALTSLQKIKDNSCHDKDVKKLITSAIQFQLNKHHRQAANMLRQFLLKVQLMMLEKK